MRERKQGFAPKLLAIVLSLMFILAMLPAGWLTALAETNYDMVFTIMVLDDDTREPLEGAHITGSYGTVPVDTTTGADGVATIQEITDAILGGSTDSLELTITAVGYVSLVDIQLGTLAPGDEYGEIGISLSPCAALITANPQGGEYAIGDPITLTVVAENAATYQWYKGSEAMAGETSDTLHIPSAVPNDSGSYTCVVTGIWDDEVTSEAAEIKVAKASQLPLIINGLDSGYTYGDGPVFLSTDDGSTGGPVSYKSSNHEVATVEGNKVTIVGAGIFEITAKMEGDDYYAPVEAKSGEIEVTPKELTITGIAAEDKTYDGSTDAAFDTTAVVYGGALPGDNISIEVTGSFASKDVEGVQTVSITGIQLDADSAKKYEVNSTDSQDEAQASITPATLTVEVKAGQSKLFRAHEPSEYAYEIDGEIGDEKAAFTGKLSRVAGEAIGEYEIHQDTLDIVDGGNGFIADNYTISYVNANKFEIKEFELPEDMGEPTLTSASGSYVDNWFREDVSIVAPEDYLVGFDKDGDDWYEVLPDPDTDEAEGKTVSFYLRRIADGAVGSELQTLEYNLDKTHPTAEITVDGQLWASFLNNITFGIFFKDTETVTIKAADELSGVHEIEYQVVNDEPDFSKNNEWIKYDSLSLNPNEKYIVYARVTDKAGNRWIISSNGMVIDSEAPTVKITAPQNDDNWVYNDDVLVQIKVDDPEVYSGIQSITYQVWHKNDNEVVVTQDGTLYTYEGIDPTYDELVKTWSGEITVDSELNNSNHVTVEVTAVDNAGNEYTESLPLMIDITPPEISVSYDNDSVNKIDEGRGYFGAARTATIKITERTENFDAGEATDNIIVIATDFEGNSVIWDDDVEIEWSTTDGILPNGDDAVHTAEITYSVDANYTFEISYTDNAGNVNEPVDTLGSVSPYLFTVDATAPEGSVTATSPGKVATWEELINRLTFSYWSGQRITVTGTSGDETSPIDTVVYHKANGTKALTAAELDATTDWKDFSSLAASPAARFAEFGSLTVSPNERFTVYVKITDMAGNSTYISTNGLIADNTAPVEEKIAPEITLSPEQPINGLYNRDVKVSIVVDDPLVGNAYSGLKTISYRVLNLGQETQSGTLYAFDRSNPTHEELLKTWTGEITVDSVKNNSNDVVIEVYAEDNALNASKDSVSIKIDITNPTISVSYDNNSNDDTFREFFKADRTATITITERNFDEAEATRGVLVGNAEGPAPVLSGWTKISDGDAPNGDGTTYAATIHYGADGVYTFDVSYTDQAGNKNEPVGYGGSVQPNSFVIDKTDPVITVTYSNNSAQNGNYYNAERTATITIDEHNFESTRVEVTGTATNDGQAVQFPVTSSWSSAGDINTATISYTADAQYTFDITYTDMAGNEAAAYEQDDFYVDLTKPEIEIAGVEDKTPYPDDIAPVISFSDTNFDSDSVTISLVGANRGEVDLQGSYSAQRNGTVFTFSNFEKLQEIDDIYTLTATTTDLAGNESEPVSVTFSVNRFGSVYTFDSSLQAINGKYVRDEIDILITETNIDSLNRDSIRLTMTFNGTPKDLVEGADYSVTEVGGGDWDASKQWSQYTYTVNKSLFAGDGRYSLAVYSVDEANNINENIDEAKTVVYADGEMKKAEISFGIDKTAPVAVPLDIEDNTQYAVDGRSATFSVKDNLVLESVEIYLNGRLVNAEEDGENFTISIPASNSKQTVKVVALDAAGNECILEVSGFLVTTNLFFRWFNNTPLFVGTLIGIALLAVGIAVFFVFFRKKKEEKKDEKKAA